MVQHPRAINTWTSASGLNSEGGSAMGTCRKVALCGGPLDGQGGLQEGLQGGTSEREHTGLPLLPSSHILLVLLVGQTQWEASGQPSSLFWSL